MALGFGLLAWMCLLFSPLAFVQSVQAQAPDSENYGTVIGIVRWTHFSAEQGTTSRRCTFQNQIITTPQR